MKGDNKPPIILVTVCLCHSPQTSAASPANATPALSHLNQDTCKPSPGVRPLCNIQLHTCFSARLCFAVWPFSCTLPGSDARSPCLTSLWSFSMSTISAAVPSKLGPGENVVSTEQATGWTGSDGTHDGSCEGLLQREKKTKPKQLSVFLSSVRKMREMANKPVLWSNDKVQTLLCLVALKKKKEKFRRS